MESNNVVCFLIILNIIYENTSIIFLLGTKELIHFYFRFILLQMSGWLIMEADTCLSTPVVIYKLLLIYIIMDMLVVVLFLSIFSSDIFLKKWTVNVPRCNFLCPEINNTNKLQTMSRFTLISGYELCSLLKTLLMLWL